MLKTYQVNLDIEKELYNPAIMSFSISQADLSIVELTLIISQDEAAFDLTDATSVQLGIKKPSGLVVYQDCEITDPPRGEIKATLTNQAYIEWGIYTAEVYIKDYNALADQDQVAVTCPFFYYSRSAVMSDEALESFNDWTALQDLLLGYDKKPILIDGIPTIAPEYAGQMAFDMTGKRAFIAGDITADSWQIIGGGEGGGGGVVSWADIIGKPATFPPTPHTHLWADIIDKPTAFQPISHSHIWADITEKPITFPPTAHAHPISDITGLQASLDGKVDDADLVPFITEGEADLKYAYKGDLGSGSTAWVDITGKPTSYPPDPHTHDWTNGITGKPATYPSTWATVSGKPTTFAPTAHTHLWADITDKPATFVPSAHTHTIANVTGLQDQLDSKIETIPPEYLTESEGDLRYAYKGEGGTGGGSVLVEDLLTSTSTTSALSANQGRILNTSKAPITHTHLWADITDKPTTFAPTAHTHTIGEVDGLSGALDDKADLVHTHLWADITDKPTTFAPAAHTHAWTEVTGKPTTFTPTAHTHLWADLTDKPATFTPSAHTHVWADLTDKPTEFKPQLMSGAQRGGAMVGNGLAMSNEYVLVKTLSSVGTKIDTVNNAVAIDRAVVDLWYAGKTHTHLWADITDKPTTFTPTTHTHLWADITDKPTTFTPATHTHDWATGITGKPNTFTPSAHTHLWADITDKPTTFTPATHTHTEAQVTFGGLNAKTYVDNGDNAVLGKLGGLTFWQGTQAAYTALGTYDSKTIYFVVG